MAKIFKISGYVIDVDEITSSGKVKDMIDHEGTYARHVHIQEARFAWTPNDRTFDENCDLAECERFFPQKKSTSNRPVAKGAYYKHFKGKLVQVLEIAEDTENPGNLAVVYRCCDSENHGKIWFRPYDMFTSKVDRKKYPDAKQEYRFELVR